MSEQKRKIIIVEDEFTFAKVIKMRLESCGYDVEIAGDAYQGTQSIISKEFDLIILDLMMPAGGGYSLLDRIRKLPTKSAIPVIIMTGKHLDANDEAAAQSLDVNAIFSKPYDTSKFLNTVMNLAPVYN
jgi:two-component system response regulator ArlR